jgi:1-acyl-sn-glycerol-3-phosphate acyltransferase
MPARLWPLKLDIRWSVSTVFRRMSSTASVSLPAADALPVTPRATPMFRLLRAIVGPLMRLVFSWKVEGRHNLPVGRPYVIIANHLNWIDAWALLLQLPAEPRIHFLANPANLVRHRFDWWLVRKVGGYIPVDLTHKASPELFEHVNLCLQRGGVVAIFPEAAYGPREGEVQPMKRGFAHFAADNHVPVVPIALTGTKELWLRKPIRMRVGEPIEPDGRDADAIYEAASTRLRELVPAYSEPAGRKPLRRFLTHLLY